MFPPPNSYVEVTTPQASERVLLWRQGLGKGCANRAVAL